MAINYAQNWPMRQILVLEYLYSNKKKVALEWSTRGGSRAAVDSRQTRSVLVFAVQTTGNSF